MGLAVAVDGCYPGLLPASSQPLLDVLFTIPYSIGHITFSKKHMPIKIEISEGLKVPAKTRAWIESILECTPREHLRGIDRIRLSDKISDPRLKNNEKTANLPGIYHPKQGAHPAWMEVAAGVLIPRHQPLPKRLMPRLSFRGNLAAIIFSLAGQHYYLTLRHSIKRGQIEPAVRSYTEKHLRLWHERQHTLRSRIFRPFQPTLERWGRALQKRANEDRKRKQSA